MFALLEYDPRFDLKAVKDLVEDKHGHPDLEWVDVTAVPGIQDGWVQYPNGRFGPYVMPLSDAKALQIETLRADCSAAIFVGFTSDALGSVNAYNSADTDQTNIDRAAMAALTGAATDKSWTAQIKCGPPGDPKTFVAHTSAQVHKVSSDLHAMVEAARLKLATLKEQVAAASTVDVVSAIVW